MGVIKGRGCGEFPQPLVFVQDLDVDIDVGVLAPFPSRKKTTNFWRKIFYVALKLLIFGTDLTFKNSSSLRKSQVLKFKRKTPPPLTYTVHTLYAQLC